MSAQIKKNTAPENSPETTVNPVALARLSAQVRTLLRFHAELGIKTYPATPELRNFLSNRQHTTEKTSSSPSRFAQTPAAPGSPRATADAPKPHNKAIQTTRKSEPEISKLIKEINSRLLQCRLCHFGQGHPVSTGRGNIRADLFVIGDSRLSGGTESDIWSAPEDELFWKMMAAIKLTPKSVYVSNLIKCCLPENLPPARKQKTARACFEFLKQEIAAIRPKLICSMGETATILLLNIQQPILRLRGRFHTYNDGTGFQVAVMPTFHPGFLLKHPEMKRLSWLDLQAIQRKLS